MTAIEALRDTDIFGAPLGVLLAWLCAGIVAAGLLFGQRPQGTLLADLIVGILGGVLGGWAASALGIDLARAIRGVDRATAAYLAEFLTALAGALAVLLILRACQPPPSPEKK